MNLADNSESKVFWLKMIGDFYRYQAETALLEKEAYMDEGVRSSLQIQQ